MIMKKRYWLYAVFLLVTMTVFFVRDPTIKNELKYLSIAKEALANNWFFAFWNHNEIYPDKPPLYIWLVMGIISFTKTYAMPLLGLFSSLPAIIGCEVMCALTKRDLTEEEQLLSCGMLLTTGFFFGAALVVRMDMLMTMFILLALYFFYEIAQGASSWQNRIGFYLSIFFAVFTKGPVGILFPALAVTGFVFRTKQFSIIKELRLRWCFTLLTLLFGLWFLGAYLQGGTEYLYALTVKQTLGRGINSFHHARPFYYYSRNIWYTMLPWSLCFMCSFFVFWKERPSETAVGTLLSSAIVLNFFAMSLFSGKLDIYLLPIYPLVPFYFLLISKRIPVQKIARNTLSPVAFVFVLGLPVAIISSMLGILPFSISTYNYIALVLAGISGGFGLHCLMRLNYHRGCWCIVVAMLFVSAGVITEIPKFNQDIGLRVVSSEVAKLKDDNSNVVSFNFAEVKNMQYYLDVPIRNYENKQQLEEALKEKDVIFLVRKKDLRRYPFLTEETKDFSQKWESGRFVLYKEKFVVMR